MSRLVLVNKVIEHEIYFTTKKEELNCDLLSILLLLSLISVLVA